MKTLLIICDNDPINLLLTNAVAKPLSKQYEVYLKCDDKFAPLFVNNRSFIGAAKEAHDIEVCVNHPSEYINVRNGIKTSQNLFQLFFSIFNLKWNGEGYNLQYFPRNKNRNMLGLSISDKSLKQYIIPNINSKTWDIPIKQNIIKQLDEINRCSHVITDNEACLHSAISLRKHVEYISEKDPNYNIEMFGNGNIHVFNG